MAQLIQLVGKLFINNADIYCFGRRLPISISLTDVSQNLHLKYLKQDHCRGVYLPPSITGEAIPFQDIHNFSFSAKIQDDIFP